MITLYSGTSKNVILNANGSASFAGVVDAGAGWDAGASNTGGNRLVEGSIYSQVPTTVGDNSAVYTVVKGTDEIIQFSSAGGAEFANNLIVGNYNSGDSTSGGVVVKSTGQLVVQGYAGTKETPSTAVQGYETTSDGTLSGSWSINTDGSASFASGTTRINSVGSLLVGTTSDLITDAKIALDAGSGSANFDGALTLGGTIDINDYDASTDKSASLINFGSFFGQKASSAPGNTPIFQGNYGGSNNVTSSINADGSADFAVDASFTKGTRSTSDVLTLYTNNSPGNASRFYIYNSQEGAGTASGYKYIIEPDGTVKLGGDAFDSPNISLNADGTASFKGDVTVANGAVLLDLLKTMVAFWLEFSLLNLSWYVSGTKTMILLALKLHSTTMAAPVFL